MSCIMKIKIHPLLFLLLICVSLFLWLKCVYGFNNNNNNITTSSVMCLDSERQALLEFKHGIVYDKYGILSSWDDDNNNISKDCCSWWGVKCNNTTAHVVSLDLHGEDSWLAGEVSFSALIKLEHLRYLDLSYNNFSGSQMGGEAIGSFHRLNHLNLSFNAFSGAIPHQLGNLSNLQSLHLRDNYFTGEVPHQLGNLSSSLHTLDLAWNSHLSTNNLVWLSQLHLLRHLDLSYMNLENITHWEQVVFFNLPFLEELYLSDCGLHSIDDVTPSSSLASPLLLTNSTSNSLSILHLYYNHLTSFPHWLLFNITTKKLVSIDLSENNLEGPIPDDAFEEMFSLQDVSMGSNHLTGGIPKSFQNVSHLRSLDLSYNNLSESFPEFLQKLSKGAESSLELLELSENQFYGPFTGITRFASLRTLWLDNNRFNGSLMSSLVLPPSLEVLVLSNNQIAGNILIECSSSQNLTQRPNSPSLTSSPSSSLTFLDLSNNRFKGSLPENIGEFSKLQYLDVSSNLLDGTISQLNFSNLYNLKYLYLSFNSLNFNESPIWMPPFQLKSLELRNCSAGPHFPQWLRTQTNLSHLDLSLNGISETIPSWFWNSITLKLEYLNLSHNQMSGSPPHLSLSFHDFSVIDLGHNNFSGPILSVPRNLSTLFLNTNKFMGAISFLCAINGGYLDTLDLSNNLFSGGLPNCWMDKTFVSVIDLSNNGLSGSIPESLGFLGNIVALNLRNNYFVGEIPFSIRNCEQLRLFDVGGNNLTGTIPSWIGMSLTSLMFLSLRSNNVNGRIPHNICHLSYIQVLDLSRNKLSGQISNCFTNFTFFVQKGTPSSMAQSPVHQYYDFNIRYDQTLGSYIYNMWVQWKRSYSVYDKLLGQQKVIDLSDNMLDGEIPTEIASLSGLVSLNLSFNHLTGNIISHIDQMEMLEVLDLSRNHLSGEIPAGLAQLTFLDALNLSYNDLSGMIPSSTQFYTFDESSYMGNKDLCGFPLEKCPDDDNDSQPTSDHGKDDNIEDEDGFMSKEEYKVMGLGFLVGFLGVLVVLCKGSWRNAYFKLLEDSYDWFYVRTVVYWLRLKRKFE